MSKQAVAEALIRVGSDLQHTPSKTLTMWPLLRLLSRYRRERVDETAVENRLTLGVVSLTQDFAQGIWESICSAASGYLPMEEQAGILSNLGAFLHKSGSVLSNPTEASVSEFLESAGSFSTAYARARERILSGDRRRQAVPVSDIDEVRLQSRVSDEAKRKLIRLVVETGSLERCKEPLFMLKSGYRSFYFFSSATFHYGSAVSHEYLTIMEPSIRSMVEEVREEGLSPQLCFARRAAGETGGAATVASEFATKLRLPASVLSPPSSEQVVDRVDGASLPREGVGVIFFDDVVTTGASARTWLERLHEHWSDPLFYFISFDRRTDPTKRFKGFEGVQVVSALTKMDLISAGVWVPELLLAKTDSQWLPALDFRSDHVKEVCEFYGVSSDDYDALITLLDETVDASLEGTSDNLSEKTRQFYRNINLLMIHDLQRFIRTEIRGDNGA